MLVETGLGLGDVRDPAGALGAAWVEMTQAVLDIVQTRSETDHDLRVDTQARLRALPREVELFSAHDPWELARYR